MSGTSTHLPVSLVLITLNEEAGLERAIRSAAFCDDVIVLDSGSTDATCEIAKRLGARVFIEPFRGYREQKARAVELARNDWIVSLDGDEALSKELEAEARTWFQTQNEKPLSLAASAPRLTWTLGRWIRRGGWYPDRQLRFFHRQFYSWAGSDVHELVRPVENPKTEGTGAQSAQSLHLFKNPIHHFPFPDHSTQVATNNHYSSLGAQALRRKGKSFSVFALILKPVGKWFECYVIKRGFLDGLPGFIIAVGAAYSMFLKYVKLWEIEKKPERYPRA